HVRWGRDQQCVDEAVARKQGFARVELMTPFFARMRVSHVEPPRRRVPRSRLKSPRHSATAGVTDCVRAPSLYGRIITAAQKSSSPRGWFAKDRKYGNAVGWTEIMRIVIVP
ncbi:unnamed protein product, partial [Hapterophycus canaliculatus]